MKGTAGRMEATRVTALAWSCTCNTLDHSIMEHHYTLHSKFSSNYRRLWFLDTKKYGCLFMFVCYHLFVIRLYGWINSTPWPLGPCASYRSAVKSNALNILHYRLLFNSIFPKHVCSPGKIDPYMCLSILCNIFTSTSTSNKLGLAQLGLGKTNF